MKASRIGGLALLVCGVALADDRATRFRATLVGGEETPAINGPGRGTFTATGDETQLDFTLTFTSLTAPPLAAHVHFGQKSVAGGVSFFLCGGGGKPPCPANVSGTVTGTVVPADVIGPAAQGIPPGDMADIVKAMRAGLAYANAHTPAHPGGEIRGQIKTRGADDDD